MPAARFKTGGRVVAEPLVDVAVDGNAVVVIHHDELAEAESPGEGTGLLRQPFHEASVAEEHVCVVIDNGEAVAVELGGEQFFSHSHAHGGGKALSERPGGGFHADGVLIFRMARRLGAVLTEGLQVVHRQPIAEQVQKRIDQHGAVPAGEHEAVAIVPLGIGVGVHHVLAPHGVGHGGGAHRHAGMAALGLLHALGGEDADCVDDFLVQTHK